LKKFFWLILPLAIFSKEIDLNYLLSKPTSLTKDYYIWRFLNENNLSYSDAQKALVLAKNINYKILKAYAKNAPKDIYKEIKCLYMPARKLLNQSPECIVAGINLQKASTLKKEEVLNLLSKIIDYQIPKEIALLFDDINSLKKEPSKFITLFNKSSNKQRKKMDILLNTKEIEEFSKSAGFDRFVKLIVFSEDFKNLSYSLLGANPDTLNPKTAFYIALEAMKRGFSDKAIKFLQKAKESYYQEKIDRANFWLYKLTNKDIYKKALINSWHNNIYSLMIKEEEKIEPNYTTFSINKIKKDFQLDPFLIDSILKDEKVKKEDYFYANTLGIYSYFVEKESRYRTQPYLFVYKKYLDSDKKREALIYSIMRQESRYIPTAISRSFALGLMQFMPFLAKATAKEFKMKNFDLDMMFEPKTALKFANQHLNFLQNRLDNELFIAYAYNGGIGFTKRKVLPLFKKYPPLLAMELVPYNESKEYGKKVLANYKIYSLILKFDFNLNHFFQKLE
jgi:soluble lytic murein transglycosylase